MNRHAADRWLSTLHATSLAGSEWGAYGAEQARRLTRISRVDVCNCLKRAGDITIAASVLIIAAPIMLVTAAAILVLMGRPIFFAHERVGQGGRKFRCLKFRTMVNNVDAVREQYLRNNPTALRLWREKQKLDVDPAVTPLGQFLRNSSIDELPQLLNVLRGDMSCVGPRPVTEKELVEHYKSHRRHYLRVRPGITGLWQVSGRSSVSYRRRIVLDCYYVRKWSLRLDASILTRTLPALLRTDQTS